MAHFSLVVIGSGSGNVVVPGDPARGPVALIESGAFGGTCINRGCIPSKILIHTADIAYQVQHAAGFGLGAELAAVDWPAIRDRTFAKTDKVAADGRRHRAESQTVTLIESRARFTGPRELTLSDGSVLTADQIVLATGARPVIPPPIAEAGVDYHTSDTVMRIDRLPASMVVVGGGYIAAELAHLFSSLGVRVSVIDQGAALLDNFDPEISRRFTELARRRWDVSLSAKVTGARRRGGLVEVETTAGDVAGELLLVAAGRKADTADLNLDVPGVRLRPDGRIEVDQYGRTTAPGIWSLGDASTSFPLKHVANAEARTLAHNLAFPGDLRPYRHEWVPSAVFTQPQIATVGAREQDLAGRRYVSAVHEYADVAYGWALRDTTGFCKLYADPVTGTLLGAHIMGDQASLLIQPLVQAGVFGQRLADVARDQYWIHPALAEVVENALLELTR
ncbi:MAG TPA: mycothione reductase [Trebonia sp.]|nr:mycothione reductase [Trebonia sp.]